ncbi:MULTISPECIES: DUF5634 family protein [Bacillus cereus group]|uniref:DUF5634 family protein n=1 Tax=Bacillus cereus group TaxID=86661 RepID=UPI00065BD78E|nr:MULTISPECIES: DUF5634 family protein [Bacillus cereus group]KMP65153.1 hypothetical protein TU57_10370 [Bacillus cereus]MDX6046680.1 DUF5634 family protein [Bacillus paranthracis]
MTTGIFFRMSVIRNDLDRFSQDMKERYNCRVVTLINESADKESVHMGYCVSNSAGVFNVLMPYEKNERNEYAVTDNTWTVTHIQTGEVTDGYKTLGHAMEYILSKDVD